MTEEDLAGIEYRLAHDVLEAFGREKLGEVFLLSVRARQVCSEELLEAAFLQVFGEQMLQAAYDSRVGEVEEVSRLFACLCNHVLTSTCWRKIRESLMNLGVPSDLLYQKYNFPQRPQLVSAI